LPFDANLDLANYCGSNLAVFVLAVVLLDQVVFLLGQVAFLPGLVVFLLGLDVSLLGLDFLLDLPVCLPNLAFLLASEFH
jgi:hypothetical protein